MTVIREINGAYYLCTVHRRRKGTRGRKKLFYKHIFLVKYTGDNVCGFSALSRGGNIGVPKELVGKRILLKVVEVNYDGHV